MPPWVADVGFNPPFPRQTPVACAACCGVALVVVGWEYTQEKTSAQTPSKAHRPSIPPKNRYGNRHTLRRLTQRERRAKNALNKWPHLVGVLTAKQLRQVSRIIEAREASLRIDKRKAALVRRLRRRDGPAWNIISANLDALRRVERGRIQTDTEDYWLSVPMERLLDPNILNLQPHNILAEAKWRRTLWDLVRTTDGKAYLAFDEENNVTVQLQWAPPGQERKIVGVDGGRITLTELLAIPSVQASYIADVSHGPAYQYLMAYYSALRSQFNKWEWYADNLVDRVSDQPFVHHVSFWLRGKMVQYPSGSEVLLPAREDLHQAWLHLFRGEVELAAMCLTEAETKAVAAMKKVADFDAGMYKGVGRALKVLGIAKAAGVLAGGILTGRGPLAAGQFVRAAVTTGLGAGGMSMAQDLAQGASAKVQGEGGFDPKASALKAGKVAVVTAVATWTGLHATRFMHQLMGQLALRIPVPDFIRRHLPELLGGASASPVVTGTQAGLNWATSEGQVPGSVGDFGQMVVDDITAGAILQVGLSPVIGRIKSSSVDVMVPHGDLYGVGTKRVVTLHHGTASRGNVKSLGKGIDPARGGPVQDFGAGFYTSEERIAANQYAKGRSGDAQGAVAEVHVRLRDLGKIVDVRPGGAHRGKWEAFLESPALGPTDPLKMTWRDFLTGRKGVGGLEMRGEAFEAFLRKEGLADADTILGPLGDELTFGITGGATTQVSVRSKEVAAHLKRLGLRWSAGK